MRKSILSSNEELKSQLLGLGVIVDGFTKQDKSSLIMWEHWLNNIEEIMKKYNFSEASEISGLRSQLLLDEPDLDIKRNKRKSKLQRYIKTITPAQTVTLHLQKSLEIKVESARDIVKQLLIAADQLGLTESIASANLNLRIDTLLIQLEKHEQLNPLIKNAFSILGKFDTIRLMAEEMITDKS